MTAHRVRILLVLIAFGAIHTAGLTTVAVEDARVAGVANVAEVAR